MTSKNCDSTQLFCNGELNLVELAKGVWRGKWLFFLVFIGSVVGAALFAYLGKPVYEVRAHVLPPSSSDIAALNVARNMMKVEPFSVEDVYSIFIRNIQSDQSLRQFFERVYLPSLSEEQRQLSSEKLYDELRSSISVAVPDKNASDRYSLIVTGNDPTRVANLARAYIAEVGERSVKEVVANAHREAGARAAELQQRIDSLRDGAKLKRKDRIVQLKEALAIADAAGLVGPVAIGAQGEQQISAVVLAELSYMRGSKVLRAELQALEGRVSDEPFIPGLRELEQKRSFYAELLVDSSLVAAFRQDSSIIVPDQPVKPRKRMILFLGVIGGGVLGILVAVIRLFIGRRFSSSR